MIRLLLTQTKFLRLKHSAKWKVRTSGRPNRRGWIRMDCRQNTREITWVRLEQNGLEVPLSPPDEWCLLPTSLFNIYGEWGQWDITHHQGDWRKMEENMEEEKEIKMRRYQYCSVVKNRFTKSVVVQPHTNGQIEFIIL